MAKDDEIDLEYARAQVAAHLPHHVRWNVKGMMVDYDLSRARAPLRIVTRDEILGGIEKQWQTLYLFGEEDVSEGEGGIWNFANAPGSRRRTNAEQAESNGTRGTSSACPVFSARCGVSI